MIEYDFSIAIKGSGTAASLEEANERLSKLIDVLGNVETTELQLVWPEANPEITSHKEVEDDFDEDFDEDGECCGECRKALDPKKEKIVYCNTSYDYTVQEPFCAPCAKGTPKSMISAISTVKGGFQHMELKNPGYGT